MKNTYIALYIISAFIFLISLLGGTLTRPIFESVSQRTMETAGFKKSYLETVDNQIDELIYKSKQIELQIEKLKRIFSSDKVDESRYQKEKNTMLERTFYSPLIGLFSFAYRVIFFFIAVIVLLFGIICHIIYRSMELRRRVRRLEEMMLAGVPR